MKIVFMGASEYGYQCFEALIKLECVEITGVITTPELYCLNYEHGMKQKEMQNPIHDKLFQRCADLKIPIHVMERMNSETTIEILAGWLPELIFVSGWYHIIGSQILKLPPKGVVGLHPSILPKYRGGAPLVWQIINGEKKAGISLFYFDEGVDTGDIIAQTEVDIQEHDTIKTLYEKVGGRGLRLIEKYIPLMSEGIAPRNKQVNLSANDIWPQRSKEDGLIDWSKSANEIYNFIRAQTKPYPGAYTVINKKKIIIWDCEIVDMD